MPRFGVGLFAYAVLLNISAVGLGQPANPRLVLDKALMAQDLEAVQSAVESARILLRDKAGVPEVPDQFRPFSKQTTLLTRAEAQLGFTAHFKELEKLRWWKIGLDPTKLTQPLR